MTDVPPAAAPAAKPPISAQSSQVVVSLAITGGLIAIGVALVIGAVITGQWAFILGTLGTIIGALATALNTPSGVSAALAEVKKPAPVDPAP